MAATTRTIPPALPLAGRAAVAGVPWPDARGARAGVPWPEARGALAGVPWPDARGARGALVGVPRPEACGALAGVPRPEARGALAGSGLAGRSGLRPHASGEAGTVAEGGARAAGGRTVDGGCCASDVRGDQGATSRPAVMNDEAAFCATRRRRPVAAGAERASARQQPIDHAAAVLVRRVDVALRGRQLLVPEQAHHHLAARAAVHHARAEASDLPRRSASCATPSIASPRRATSPSVVRPKPGSRGSSSYLIVSMKPGKLARSCVCSVFIVPRREITNRTSTLPWQPSG
jgi:hypothetical protein